MKYGFLNSIRWEPFPKIADLAAKAAKSPLLRMFLETGIPRPPQSRTVKEEVIFLLRCAAEIEHSLLVQYLFSAYSINAANTTARNWVRQIIKIAKEEMGHLICVQNLLLVLGAEPHFDREQLTTDPFPFQLERISKDAMAKYVTTESPVKPPPNLQKHVGEIELIANQALEHPCIPVQIPPGGPIKVKHVGVLYAWLYWLFMPSDDLVGPWKNLPADELSEVPIDGHLRAPEDYLGLKDPRQAAPIPTDWGNTDWGMTGTADGPLYVRLIESSDPMAPDGPLKMIFDIAAQGEGPEDESGSHFRRFLKIYDQLEAMSDADLATIALPVACSPSVDPIRPGRTITHEVAKRWAELFNTRYQLLVVKMWYLMSQPRSNDSAPPAKRPSLIAQSVNLEMKEAITPIARKLVRLPLKPRPSLPAQPEEFAGPPFELPDTALPSDPVRQRAKLVELIDRSAEILAALRKLKTDLPASDPDRPTDADDVSIWQPLEADDKILRPLLLPS
jgi:hypothetical protein